MQQVLAELKRQLNQKNVLVACSTGVDSTVLLELVLQAKTYAKLVIAHVNHQKRAESEIEEAYLVDYAKKKNLLIYTKRLAKNYQGNFQEWARNERYQFFLSVAKKEHIDLILTAHHADDNLETILMRIMKTSSLKGYGGIEKWSTLGEYKLYRPLLEVSKDQILAFAKKNKLTYFDDASNFEDDYLRNRIRNKVIPLLKQENPSLENAIISFSDTIFQANELVEEQLNSFIKQEVLVNNKDIEHITFSLESFLNLSPFMQVQVLFRLLKKHQLTRNCIDELIKQIQAKKNTILYQVNPLLLMIKEYGTITFTKPVEKQDIYMLISEEGEYELPFDTKIIINKNICNFKAENLNLCYTIQELPVIIRTRKPGDRIRLKSGTKKVSDYLTDKKVPHLKREQIHLLCNQNEEVLAILGLVPKVVSYQKN